MCGGFRVGGGTGIVDIIMLLFIIKFTYLSFLLEESVVNSWKTTTGVESLVVQKLLLPLLFQV